MLARRGGGYENAVGEQYRRRNTWRNNCLPCQIDRFSKLDRKAFSFGYTRTIRTAKAGPIGGVHDEQPKNEQQGDLKEQTPHIKDGPRVARSANFASHVQTLHLAFRHYAFTGRLAEAAILDHLVHSKQRNKVIQV